MIVFPCQVCQTPLSASEAQAGQLVRCPTCSTTLRVPAGTGAGVGARQTVGAGASAGGGGYGMAPPPPSASATPGSSVIRSSFGQPNIRGGGRRYGFNCGYCSSRLEATESMGAQEGQCPICGNNITIPILDRYGRLIDPKTRQIIKQDP